MVDHILFDEFAFWPEPDDAANMAALINADYCETATGIAAMPPSSSQPAITLEQIQRASSAMDEAVAGQPFIHIDWTPEEIKRQESERLLKTHAQRIMDACFWFFRARLNQKQLEASS